MMRSVFVTAILLTCVIAGAATTRSANADESKSIRNVVFIISDDLKASALACYGNTVCATPNIDRLAREGVLFRHAYCQGTWCLPSRQSFMYSKYQGPGSQTMGEYLRQKDFYTARVGKIFHMRVPGDIIDGTDGPDVIETWTERFNSPGREAHTPGDYACLNLNIFTDAEEDRQSTAMPHRMFVTVEYDGDGSDQPDAKSATKAIELLRAKHESPFFLAVGFVRPHYPMVAPREYFQRYDHRTIELPEVPEDDLEDIPEAGLRGIKNGTNRIGNYPENQKRMWAGYYATVTFMDRQVGRVLDEIDRLGIRDETAVVFTSDHGYHLGEHTHWQKKNFHEEVTRVPLIIDAPGYPSGTSDSLVELVDVYPTLVDVLGLPVPTELQGKSLEPVLSNHDASVRESALSLDKHRKSWEFADRGRRWAYMRYGDGSEELYDMLNDPKQFDNLAGSESHAATLEMVRQRLDRKLKQFDLSSGSP